MRGAGSPSLHSLLWPLATVTGETEHTPGGLSGPHGAQVLRSIHLCGMSLPPLLMSGFAFTGASLGACAVGVDEPGPEGLTSTSLLDLLLPTDFEPLDSEEPSEAMGLGAGLAPGSGFPSEDSEESRLLQPPQYFWEEEELNGSSLDLGPTAGSSDHLSPHRIPGVVYVGRGHGAVSTPIPSPFHSLVLQAAVHLSSWPHL